MSVANFIPTIWHNGIFQQYDKAFVFANLANREYEGEIRGYGDKVKINQIGDVSVNNYTASNISYETPEDASLFLEINKQKYTAVEYADIDAAQVKPKLVSEITRKMAVAMADAVDQDFAALYTSAGVTSGTTGSPIAITSANVIQYLGQMNRLLDENNNPTAGRVAVVPPWFILKMTLAKINKDTDNTRTLETGYFGSYMGFDIYMSNNISHSGTTWYAPMFFLRGETIAHAEQLSKVRAIEDKDRFSDYMSALLVYGQKVKRASSLGVLYCAEAAEA